jgi:hypothetical protein
MTQSGFTTGWPRHQERSPAPGQSTACNESRVQLAGGLLNSLLVHPNVTPYERVGRRIPVSRLYSPALNPQLPVVMEIVADRVPQTFALLVLGLRADIYRNVGVDVGDTIPVEERRFSSICGFQFLINDRTPANIEYQLEPAPGNQSVQFAFQPQIYSSFGASMPSFNGEGSMQLLPGENTPPPAFFEKQRASEFAAASGVGLATQPQRTTRYGALDVPFTVTIESGQTWTAKFIAWRRFPTPIAFIEYSVTGLLIPNTWVKQIQACATPIARPAP